METSNKTARELYEIVKADRSRRRFGFGRKPALVNVDLQNAYTRPDEFPTAYETDPRQIEHVNPLAGLFRAKDCPVIWTYVAYMDIRRGLRRLGHPERHAQFAAEHQGGLAPRRNRRALRDRPTRDIVINKRMASAFFETNLGSLFTWHKVDTVIVTGGSTSGCVRATVVDSLSRGFRTVVPEECVADRHESPHFANLYDMALKYADVLPVAEVSAFMEQYPPAN